LNAEEKTKLKLKVQHMDGMIKKQLFLFTVFLSHNFHQIPTLKNPTEIDAKQKIRNFSVSFQFHA
jgi:hypothetical protein